MSDGSGVSAIIDAFRQTGNDYCQYCVVLRLSHYLASWFTTIFVPFPLWRSRHQPIPPMEVPPPVHSPYGGPATSPFP